MWLGTARNIHEKTNNLPFSRETTEKKHVSYFMTEKDSIDSKPNEKFEQGPNIETKKFCTF